MRVAYSAIALVIASVLAGLLSGCGASEPPSNAEPTSIDWTAVNQSVGECLTDRGWSVSYDDDGSVLSEHPVEQSEAFMADNNECIELHRPAESEPTEKQWTNYFESLKSGAACLEEMGYEISPPPSREVFVQSYMEDPWLPHSEALRTASVEEQEDIFASCPPPLLG